MIEIFILNETNDKSYDTLSSEIKLLDPPKISIFKHVSELEIALKSQPLDLLVIVVNESPSSDLINLISKNKNASHLRDTAFISIHKKGNSAGIQKALMAGVKTLFLEPVAKEKIIHAIKALLNEDPSSLPVLPGFRVLSHSIPLRAHVFGRIGKLYLDSLGDLQIETDVQISIHQDVSVLLKLAKDLGATQLLYKVSSVRHKDTYYHYENNYHLSWLPTPEQKKNLTNWLATSAETIFAIPKTKVLWIHEEPLGPWESLLDKTLFSVYAQKPGKVTHAFLDRLSPRIILTHQLPGITRTQLGEWMNENSPDEKRVINTDDFESPESFQMAFNSLIQPFLAKRVSTSAKSAKYFDRKSDYSRCAITMDGQVISVSKTHILLELPFALERDTVFLAHCPALEDKKTGLYLKVFSSEPVPISTSRIRLFSFRLVCEILPITDSPQIQSAPLKLNSQSLLRHDESNEKVFFIKSDSASGSLWKTSGGSDYLRSDWLALIFALAGPSGKWGGSYSFQ